MTIAGIVIVAAAGFGIFVVGILYLANPRMMAANFGLPAIPDEAATPWLRLKGIRDLATGVAAGVLLLSASMNVIGLMVIAFAIIPLGDAVTILHARGPLWAALGIHGATAVLMLIGAALLLGS